MSKDNNDNKSNNAVYNSSFGRNLEKLLDQLDIKKVDLAKAIGVTKGTITNICKGYNYPHVSTILKICNYLNVDIDLLTESDPKLKMLGESAQAYASLKEALVNIGALKEDEEIKKYQKDYLDVDFISRKVLIDQEEIHLTPIEFNLLKLLIEHRGKVLTHNYIQKDLPNND